MKRLATRGRETAEAIANRETFKTSGALKAEEGAVSAWDSGRLRGADLEQFYNSLADIEYVVYSYATPIAWWGPTCGWYRVEQKFSVTTTKHQGNLYLIEGR